MHGFWPTVLREVVSVIGSDGCSIRVGIDDISVYVPRLFISTTGEFATSRGLEPAKLTRGIGIERIAVPDRHEDAATMAAMSALDLIRRNGVNPEKIGRIYVGTESAVDEAKAIGTYVIGMLEKVLGSGSLEECSTVEFKSACIGATHALENVCDWLRASDEGQVGIVIASDIAKYGLRTPGEYTQGAGAVSLLVKRDPRLIEIEPYRGVYTRDENDFFRPVGRATAVVNGKHSNSCYLSAMEGAFVSYRRKVLSSGAVVLGPGECLTDHVSAILFHIPYPRMVEYAAEAIFSQEWRSLLRWRGIVESEIGPEPVSENFSGEEEYQRAAAQYMKKFSKSSLFLDAFNSKVRDSTRISGQVGNAYTGSIYLGLASLLEAGELTAGSRICFGSYGSGCSAAVFSGLVQPGVGTLASTGISRRLEERMKISVQDYEQLHEGSRDRSVVQPSEEFALLEIDDQGYRRYDFVI